MDQSRPILITGSNGGMGTALVEYLLCDGYRNVVCHYRTDSDAIATVLRAHDIDPELHLVQADLLDEAEVSRLRQTVEERWGNLWGLVNLAGLTTNAVSWKMTLQDFRAVIDANLTTTFLTTREFIPSMRAQGGGRIINTASVVAFVGGFGASHYAAAKSAIVGLTKGMAIELVAKNITANVISLGYFEYGMISEVPAPMLEEIKKRIPVNRLGKINEFGGMVKFLLGEDSSYVTAQTLHINGGQYF